jgi:hypothetical protein
MLHNPAVRAWLLRGLAVVPLGLAVAFGLASLTGSAPEPHARVAAGPPDAGSDAAPAVAAAPDAGEPAAPPGDGGAAPGPVVPAGPRGAIAGEVFDERGWPIAGARVRVVDDEGAPVGLGAARFAARLEPAGELGVLRGPLPFPLDPHPGFAALPAAGAAEALSDAAGRFHIAGMPPARLVLLASHDEFADGRSEPFDVVAGAEVRVQVALRRGRPLRARVVDDRGPIAGAEVWASGVLLGMSDKSGTVEVRKLVDPVEIEVKARAHLPARRAVDPALDREVEVALLHAAGRVTGVVVDERGFPASGARVAMAAGPWHGEAVADARGEFTVEGTPDGALSLRASHPNHPTARVEHVASGDDVRVALAPGGGVEGDARDERTGAVPPGLKVEVTSAGEAPRTAPFDKQGRFRLTGCAAGPALVRATAPGYPPVQAEVVIPASESAGEVTLRDVRLALALGGAIAGEVRDGRGDPAAGIEVSAGGQRARTDGSGRFRIGPLPPGDVEVKAGGASERARVEAGGEARVELRLR